MDKKKLRTLYQLVTRQRQCADGMVAVNTRDGVAVTAPAYNRTVLATEADNWYIQEASRYKQTALDLAKALKVVPIIYDRPRPEPDNRHRRIANRHKVDINGIRKAEGLKVSKRKESRRATRQFPEGAVPEGTTPEGVTFITGEWTYHYNTSN